MRAAQIPAAWQALCFRLIPFSEAIVRFERVRMNVCALVLGQRGIWYGGKWATAGFEAGGWLRCRYLVNRQRATRANMNRERPRGGEAAWSGKSLGAPRLVECGQLDAAGNDVRSLVRGSVVGLAGVCCQEI